MSRNGNNATLALKREIEEYERFLGGRVGWLERLGDAFTGIDERVDYTNRLLIRILTAAGVPPPPRPTGDLDGLIPVVLPPTIPTLPQVVVPIGRPVSRHNSITTTEQTEYQTVVEWTIPQLHTGELHEITMATNNYTKTVLRLVLAGEEQWADQTLIGPLTQPFRGNKLFENTVVGIYAKSSDGTAITVYAGIAGKLIQPQTQ